MKHYIKPLVSVVLAIAILTTACSESNNDVEKIEIKTMDSTSKAVEENTEKLEDQTKKVEASLERLEKEFETAK